MRQRRTHNKLDNEPSENWQKLTYVGCECMIGEDHTETGRIVPPIETAGDQTLGLVFRIKPE